MESNCTDCIAHFLISGRQTGPPPQQAFPALGQQPSGPPGWGQRQQTQQGGPPQGHQQRQGGPQQGQQQYERGPPQGQQQRQGGPQQAQQQYERGPPQGQQQRQGGPQQGQQQREREPPQQYERGPPQQQKQGPPPRKQADQPAPPPVADSTGLAACMGEMQVTADAPSSQARAPSSSPPPSRRSFFSLATRFLPVSILKEVFK